MYNTDRIKTPKHNPNYDSPDAEIGDRAPSIALMFCDGLVTTEGARRIAHYHGTSLATLEHEDGIRRVSGMVWGLDLLTALGY